MKTSQSSDAFTGCLIKMLTTASVLFFIAGGLFIYPTIRDELLPPPPSFGENQPLLRPTVTPLPGQSQLPAANVPPALLPETPLLAPQQTPTVGVLATPVVTDSLANIPTRIVIPAINLDAAIVPVGWSAVNGVNVWDIPNYYAAGWLKTSATLGVPGNTVLDGHHNIEGEVFRYLVNLKPGDGITVYAGQQPHFYEVTALHILPDRGEPIEVREQNAAWIQPTLDERLTLVTCWPYTNNTHRLIVVAKPFPSN